MIISRVRNLNFPFPLESTTVELEILEVLSGFIKLTYDDNSLFFEKPNMEAFSSRCKVDEEEA